jgi:hypothetical protein
MGDGPAPQRPTAEDLVAIIEGKDHNPEPKPEAPISKILTGGREQFTFDGGFNRDMTQKPKRPLSRFPHMGHLSGDQVKAALANQTTAIASAVHEAVLDALRRT